MSNRKRKIGFYHIDILDTEKDVLEDYAELYELAVQIIGLGDRTKRTVSLTEQNKFYLLEEMRKDGGDLLAVFISAKYNHCPPLIDRDTGIDRKSPKNRTEGEEELTHVYFHPSENGLMMLLEERQVGITAGRIATYFNDYAFRFHKDGISLSRVLKIDLAVIVLESFLKELEKTKYISVADFYVKKKLLGSEFKNLFPDTKTIHDTIVMTVKSNRGGTLQSVVRRAYEYLCKHEEKLLKIRAYGSTEEKSKLILDTDFMKRFEYIKVELDKETQIVNTQQMFEHMRRLANRFNV
jgi:hypothetical protein